MTLTQHAQHFGNIAPVNVLKRYSLFEWIHFSAIAKNDNMATSVKLNCGLTPNDDAQ